MWRVVGAYYLTLHVWKSCEYFQYRWSNTTRLKDLWRVVSTGDLTQDVWKSCECCQYSWSHTTRLRELWMLSVSMISYYTSAKLVTCCQYQWFRTTRKMMYETTTGASDFSILTAVVLDVGPRWIQSRLLHIAARKQTAVVVVNKGRSRTGQAVHRRLIQQNVVAETCVTESTRALLVRRDRPGAGWSVMRRTILTIIKVRTFWWWCCVSCCIVLLTFCSL